MPHPDHGSTTMTDSSAIRVPRLPRVPGDACLNTDILSRFSEPLEFHQNWLDEKNAEFQAGQVWFAHDGERLMVYARLQDRCPFSEADGFNDERREQGDYLEVLIRPDQQERYDELHVTPAGGLAQLRFEDLAHVQRLRQAGPDQPIIPMVENPDPVFDASARIDAANGCWTACVRIDMAKVLATPVGEPVPERWYAAVCRWDHNPTTGQVVESATAMYTQHNYHRHDEWHTLQLEPSCAGGGSG